MKSSNRPGNPDLDKTHSGIIPISVLSRIKLALLDEYKAEKIGYDPYDTSAARARDLWSGKRKRA